MRDNIKITMNNNFLTITCVSYSKNIELKSYTTTIINELAQQHIIGEHTIPTPNMTLCGDTMDSNPSAFGETFKLLKNINIDGIRESITSLHISDKFELDSKEDQIELLF